LAAVGGEGEAVVAEAGVDGAEGSEEAVPGVVAAFEDIGAEAIGVGLELFADGGDGVGLGVDGVGSGKQVPFFGEEEEDEAHHDGEGGLIEDGLGDAFEEAGGGGILVGAVEGRDEEGDGLADLAAELGGNGALIEDALFEQAGEGGGRLGVEPAASAEQGAKGAEGDGLFEPHFGIPDGGTGDAGGSRGGIRGMEDAPLLAVGEECDREAGGAEEGDGAVEGAEAGGVGREEAFEFTAAGSEEDGDDGMAGGGSAEEVFGGRGEDEEVGDEIRVELGEADAEGLRDVLPGSELLRGELEDLGKDEAEPGELRGGVGGRGVAPGLVGEAEAAEIVGEGFLPGEALGEGTAKDFATDEGALDLHEEAEFLEIEDGGGSHGVSLSPEIGG
jgi:hypothetical protein